MFVSCLGVAFFHFVIVTDVNCFMYMFICNSCMQIVCDILIENCMQDVDCFCEMCCIYRSSSKSLCSVEGKES